MGGGVRLECVPALVEDPPRGEVQVGPNDLSFHVGQVLTGMYLGPGLGVAKACIKDRYGFLHDDLQEGQPCLLAFSVLFGHELTVFFI